MKTRLAWTLALCAGGLSSPAWAAFGALDTAPAATLLFPYVEADLDSATGADTWLSIHNDTLFATLTNVVIWSSAGVPVTQFNLYLTGYDVETFSIRAALLGTPPATASAGQDPTDTISPKGARSQDINWASCNGVLPPPAVSAQETLRIQAALTGAPLPGMPNSCAAPSHGDRVARGYVTVDVVETCSTKVPGDVGYFDGAPPVATRQNRLLGEFILSNPAQHVTAGAPAIHVEASAAAISPVEPTFYARLVGFTGVDGREALPGTYAVPYVSGRADLLVWRDPKVRVAPYDCASQPAYGALPLEAAWIFDRQETVVDMTNQKLFPDVVNRVQVGDAALPVLAREGWMSLSLHHTSTAAPGLPFLDPASAQGVVLVLTQPESTGANRPFSVLQVAVPTDSPLYSIHLEGYP